jgi:pre-mRNA-splicing factor ATP-dependent RNA helicase DHX15/PRP43
MNKNIGILDPSGLELNPLNSKEYSKKYKELAELWSKYPAYENANDTIELIKSKQVLLITSGTGSGKTVLIPKFTLHSFDYKGNILVSLPKQLVAQSAAEFSALTMDVNLGEQIGYKYKGSDTKYIGKNPNLLYCTDGTIVAKLLQDPNLSGIDAVIIDEAHERKVQIDFMLYLLKNVVKNRPEFKLIIMSATVNSEIFKSYFAEFNFGELDIGSKTNFEIESIFVKNTIQSDKYIEEGIKIIENILQKKETGKISDILFFVTSINETIDIAKKLRPIYPSIEFIEVYSGISSETQEKIGKKTTLNQRVLISTNVAESSLTVDGIKYVIDSGYELLSYYNPEKRGRVLEKGLITLAQAKQRMGRAGRTAPGICYHLYSKEDFDNFMKKYPEPSIRTSDITNEILKLLSLEKVQTVDNVLSILTQLIEPPREIYIKSALKTLYDLDLISKNKINNLGMFCAESQLEPSQALSVYCAYNLYCADDVILILLGIELIKNNLNEIFINPIDLLKSKQDKPEIYKIELEKLNKKFSEKREKLIHKYGDHLTLLKIYKKFEKLSKENEKREFCQEYFLKYKNLSKLEDTYERIKYKIKGITKKFIESPESDEFKIKNIDKLKELEPDYRILFSIMYGYKLNKAFYSNKSYRTLYTDRVNISKDSTLYNCECNIIYTELFISGKNENLNICSRIPSKLKEFI